MMAGALVLRDIHVTPAPSWWPPAPGWWIVAAAMLALLAGLAWWRLRARRRRRAVARLFDERIDAATSPAQQVAAMSELLRRAARRRDPHADRLAGEEWLRFLDPPAKKRGPSSRDFSEGAGRLLLDGGFRREADAAQVEALRRIARERFLHWMSAS
ncbi:MAG TPA: DUF4381 family protein [Lysobacter sp.]